MKPANYPVEPSALWNAFYELSQVPRPSKHEEKFIEFLEQKAKSLNKRYVKDCAGNIIIYLPATKGFEDYPTIILQGHMDMVCEKTPERVMDFFNDPLTLQVENGWIKADRTTLGADNGFACAVMLALLNSAVEHPALELLFTTDEETGLHGAKNLETKYLSGTRMINLDTEEWGAIYIGCAGGIDYEMEGELAQMAPSSTSMALSLTLGGLAGGHSGLDIHKGKANAMRLLGEILIDINNSTSLSLSTFVGGRAHNVIPREATASFTIDSSYYNSLVSLLDKKIEQFKSFLNADDQGVFYKLEKVNCESVLTNTDAFLNFLALYPHGAAAYNWSSAEPLVTYSSNMAIIILDKGKLYSQTSLRFSDSFEPENLKQRIRALSKLLGLKLIEGVGYPSWKPDFSNEYLKKVSAIFEQKYSRSPKIKAIHAGLECGILKEKLKNIDIISLGPNIKGAHSPTERLEIQSSVMIWDLLTEILKIR